MEVTQLVVQNLDGVGYSPIMTETMATLAIGVRACDDAYEEMVRRKLSNELCDGLHDTLLGKRQLITCFDPHLDRWGRQGNEETVFEVSFGCCIDGPWRTGEYPARWQNKIRCTVKFVHQDGIWQLHQVTLSNLFFGVQTIGFEPIRHKGRTAWDVIKI